MEKESDAHRIARLEFTVKEQRENITALNRCVDNQNDRINLVEGANKKIVAKLMAYEDIQFPPFDKSWTAKQCKYWLANEIQRIESSY